MKAAVEKFNNLYLFHGAGAKGAKGNLNEGTTSSKNSFNKMFTRQVYKILQLSTNGGSK